MLADPVGWWEAHSAQVLECVGPDGQCFRHLKVWRDDGRDGISWDVLMQIKHELLGETVAAVEVFPPMTELVNDVNMRHLYEIPWPQAFNLYKPH